MIHEKLRLACWTAAAIVVWLVILPWVAARPDMQRRIEFLEQRRIDPSAMFYTEVESMNEVRQRMAQRRQQHPHSFGVPFNQGATDESRTTHLPRRAMRLRKLRSVVQPRRRRLQASSGRRENEI
jgi:hypothetical protein